MARGSQRNAEPLTLNGGSLGDLAFEWIGDRYGHQWRFDNTLLVSADETTSSPWPETPPLQQIHQQSFGDGREVVFGVGMAGRGHWSASFTLIPELRCWIVELACRSPVRPENLVSTYIIDSHWNRNDAGVWERPLESGRISVEAIQPATLATGTDSLLQLKPAAIVPHAPSTTQWAFRVRVA